MELKKYTKVMSCLAFAIFLAVFGSIFLQIVFFSSEFNYSVLLEGLLLAVWLLVLGGIAFIGYKNKDFLTKYRYLALGAVVLFVFAVQFFVGLQTRQNPMYDYKAVLDGARVYASQGNSAEFAQYSDYMHHFTNNVGLFLILQFIFKTASLFGITSFYMIAVTIGHLLFSVTIVFTFLYLEKAFGKTSAMLSLVFFVAFLPVYFQTSVAYTDTYSIWAIPVILYLSKVFEQQKKLVFKIITAVGVGVAAVIGGQIKATIFIILVAVLCQMIINANRKQLACFALATVVTVMLGGAAFNAIKYNTVLDKSRVQQESVPITYWLMMGLNENGKYDLQDEKLTCSVTGVENRIALNKKVIGERLDEMGVGGYFKLLHRKTCWTFGSGNAEIDYSLNFEPLNPQNKIYSIISKTGEHFSKYDYLSQAVYVSFYIFGIIGVAIAFIKKNKSVMLNSAPFIGMIGFYLFMMLWESNYRQLINQWSVFIIISAVGAAGVVSLLPNKKADK